MSLLIPEPVRELLTDAVAKVPRPLDKEVIARAFQVIEKHPDLLGRYREIALEYSPWTVNKFGGMAVRELLGWEKEEGNPRPAIRFTSLIKSYTRLVPPGEGREEGRQASAEIEQEEPDVESVDSPPLLDVEDFPEIRDWVTVSRNSRDSRHHARGCPQEDRCRETSHSVHRLGDRSYLVLLRSEVERARQPAIPPMKSRAAWLLSRRVRPRLHDRDLVGRGLLHRPNRRTRMCQARQPQDSSSAHETDSS